MESKLMFLVVCVICCAVSCIKAESPTKNVTSKITRNDCGKTKLCVENPKGCDPSGSSQCYFTSVALSNSGPTVELSGNSSGYIALVIGNTSNVSQGHNSVYVCGNNNGTVFFKTTMLQNNKLEITNTSNERIIQHQIQPNLIQCVLSIPIDENVIGLLLNVNDAYFDISNIANTHIPVFLDILKGLTNGTELGAPTSVLESSVLVNLADVNSTNVVSTPASTTTSTTASTTTSTTASTTTSTTASTTTSATASTTDSTTTSATASTTAKTTTRTTASTAAKSNASITIISLLSPAAICLLSIFLHLI